MNVVTRIPPSPTGHLHIGTARTALFNFLFARHHGGVFRFRSEDTDRARSTKAFEEEILEGLAWLGLTHDGEILRQSENQSRYQEQLASLIEKGLAYVREEESMQEPGTMAAVVRLKNPGKVITFNDLIRGDISFDTSELGDFVIARSITDPIYHFAVVVDDADTGVTHVIRGEDHISNTPRQILIQEALGVSRPQYAHLPLILAPDRSKMSKRHGAVSLFEYREQGFLKEAIINYLALLGWNPKSDREDFSLSELVDVFDLSQVHKSGAVFDIEKFKSVNQRYVRRLSNEALLSYTGLEVARTHPRAHSIAELIKERVHTLGEASQLLSEELSCLFEDPLLDKEVLLKKELATNTPEFTKQALEAVLRLVNGLQDEVSVEVVKETLLSFADAQEAKGKGGRGAVLWPLRYALSGKERSPDPFTLIYILGKHESEKRIEKALATIA